MGSITILPYQPIKFKNSDDLPSVCECNIQSYCQIVAQTDPTQFQIRSSNDVVNGNFEDQGEGWISGALLSIDVYNITNESEPGLCDGSFEVEIGGFTGSITAFIDGVSIGTILSNHIFENLCAGCSFYTFEDSTGKQTSIEVCIYENVDCSAFEGATLDDIIASGKTLAEFYNCTLDDLKL